MKPQHTRKTPTETMHSPTPWKVREGKMNILGDTTQPIIAKDGVIFAFVSDENLKDDSRQQANAAFIVQACNAHEALKISLNQALLDLKDLIDCGEIPPDALKHFKVTLEDGKAALKLAGEV